MKRPWHRQLTILLIAAQLTICVGNEALHLLPGMGHYVRMPSGICLWLGDSENDRQGSDQATPSQTGTTWELPNQKKGDILSEDECGICSLYSLSYQLNIATYCLPSDTISSWSTFYQPIVASADGLYLHGARAPPACEPSLS